MNRFNLLMIGLVLLLIGFFSSSISNDLTGELSKNVGLEKETFKDYIYFRVQQESRLSYSEGVVNIDLPRDPISCTLEGEWVTDDDLLRRQRRYCHAATGSFKSYVDFYGQYVINDPGYFAWAGLTKQKVDPPLEKYEGYVLYMNTCDNNYYKEKRYYIRAKVINFSKDLKIQWYYFNEDTKPAVDFMFDVKCDLVKSKKVPYLHTEDLSFQELSEAKGFYGREIYPSDSYIAGETLFSLIAKAVKKLTGVLFF